MKKLIALALMTAAVSAQAGIIADTPTGWFVSADQKNGITFGDGDYSKKKSFTIYQGEILVGGKCNLKDKNACTSFAGNATPVSPGVYKYASKSCKLTIKEEERDVVITDVEGCGKDGYKLSNIYLPVGM
ncbi:MAG: hypothetical protein ACOYBQ_06925 [Fluviibacter sp.]|jgi:hypothetical protein